MIALPSFGSSSFKLMARGLVELHRLIKEGRDDSPEGESVRDALDTPLHALNRTEKERAEWLTVDLYSVSEPPAASTLKEMTPQAQQQLIEAYEAQQNQEWDRALELLRRWQEYISPALLSYMRGLIWGDAGYPEVAAMFYGHATELDPTNANCKAIYMHALEESNPHAAIKYAREVLADHETQAPVVVTRAADILFNESRTASKAESAQLYRVLIPILERNLKKIEIDAETASRASSYAMTAGLLGVCQEFLGNAGAAVNYYTHGLRESPNNDGLLVARGILQYGRSPLAITDFEQAERLGSTLVWPYLFLAHHCLITNQFEQCRVMCERGLRQTGSNSAKSQLEEWRAISQAALGFPPDAVRTAFEAAVRWDSSNESAVRNREVYEASLRTPHSRPNSTWEKKSEAAIRQFGIVERRYQSRDPVIAG